MVEPVSPSISSRAGTGPGLDQLGVVGRLAAVDGVEQDIAQHHGGARLLELDAAGQLRAAEVHPLDPQRAALVAEFGGPVGVGQLDVAVLKDDVVPAGDVECIRHREAARWALQDVVLALVERHDEVGGAELDRDRIIERRLVPGRGRCDGQGRGVRAARSEDRRRRRRGGCGDRWRRVFDAVDVDPPCPAAGSPAVDLVECVLVGLRHFVAFRFLRWRRLGAARHGATWRSCGPGGASGRLEWGRRHRAGRPGGGEHDRDRRTEPND